MLPWLWFFSYEHLSVWGRGEAREIELCLLKEWVCHLENLASPLATWWDGESSEVSCPSHPSPVPCPTTMVVAFGSFSLFCFILVADSQPVWDWGREGWLSHWVQQSLLQATLQMAKEFTIKMLLPVYNFVIPFFLSGAEDLRCKLDLHYCFCLWWSIFVEHSALTEAWWELAGLGWAAFLPVPHHTPHHGDVPLFYPF